jgi:short-subunit dehydrogenase
MAQTFLITGASSGIGKSLALELAKRGIQTVLFARREDRLQLLEKEIQTFSSAKTLTVVGDVRKEEDLIKALDAARVTFGSVDGVFANAGYAVGGAFEELSVKDYQNQFDTNVFGVLKTLKVFLPEVKRNRGYIALTGSILGHISPVGLSPYCMSKFAVRALGVCLHSEMKKAGVSVTHVAPGFVESEIYHVKNDGNFDENYGKLPPIYLRYSSERAARVIVKAVLKRKAEVLVTPMAYWMEKLHRWFPKWNLAIANRLSRSSLS